MKVYRIFNTRTGLWSKGGTKALFSPRGWSSVGKVWTSAGSLRSHLTLIRESGPIPPDWQVVEYDLELEGEAILALKF
jgi:hypothetical protein